MRLICGVVLGGFALAVGCAGGAGRTANNGPGATVEVAGSAAPSAVVTETPQVRPKSTSKRRVACGPHTCGEAQICCIAHFEHEGAKPPRCLAERSAKDCAQMRMECDDTSDCKAGQVCCSTFDEGLDGHTVCGSLPCKRGAELCRPGISAGAAGCREGYACLPSEGGKGGSCYFQASSVRCGTKTCAGATPVCRWDQASKKGSCEARKAAFGISTVACDDHDDCGPGNKCVVAPMATACFGPEQYDTSLTNASIACSSNADCPKMHVGMPMSCKQVQDGPPGLKMCTVQQP